MAAPEFAAQVPLAAVATSAFAYLFGLGAADILVASAGSALGWAVQLAAANFGLTPAVQLFIAATAVGLWGEAAGAVRKRPATVYTIAGIIPLVPGGGMYYMILESISGNSWKSIQTAVATISAAFAIAAGLAIAGGLAGLAGAGSKSHGLRNR